MKSNKPGLDAKVRRLVDALVAESRRLAEVDSTFAPATLRPPATAEELTALEAYVGKTLPPSLRELLSITNGATNLCVWGDFFSTREMMPGSTEHARLAALQGTIVSDSAGRDHVLIPPGVLAISDRRGDQPDCVYLDPRRARADGEWTVVAFDHESDAVRHRDLLAFLRDTLDTMKFLIAEATKPPPAPRAKAATPENRPLILGADGRPLNR